MSETLRDLVVSLSLQTDNFTRNIASVNKQIKEAESYFKLASAGVQNFEQNVNGLTSQLSSLENKLNLQKTAVEQYEKALQAARDKLQECYDRQNDYAQRLEEAKEKQSQLREQVERASAQYETYKNTLGETDSVTVAAKANLDALKDEYKTASEEVTKLSGQNTALQKATQNAADAVTTAETKLNNAQAAVKETEGAIKDCNDALSLAQTSWYEAGNKIDESKQALVAIGKEMKIAESEFKLATAGIKDVDGSVEGLTAKLDLLNKKLALQEQAVTQYTAALEAAKEQLEAAKEANDPEKIRDAENAVRDATAELNNAQAAVNQTRADIDECTNALRVQSSAWTEAGAGMTEFAKKCDTVSKTAGKIGRTLSTVITAPIVALGTTAVNASIEFESSFASVHKTVEATEAEFAQLEAASKRMSTEVAASTTTINEVMATGGQLGIATEHLEEFTRVMIDLGNSCEDLSADEAASSIAKFANIMGTDQSLFENIGSTIVDLGNNFATTEQPIMQMAQRLAGAGKQVGMSEADILGFAAALSSVGIEAQMGGSAFSKALVKMEVASVQGGQDLEDFATVAGMTSEQFKSIWDSDPSAAFMAFIVGLSQMDDEGESAIAVLNDIGISEVRLRDTLLRATNATDLFDSALARANSAWSENTALSTEANKRYATTESKLTNLKNKALLFAQQLGDDLNPTIQNLISGVGDFIDKLMNMDAEERQQIIKFAAIAAAAGPVVLAFSKITKGVGTVVGGLGKFATAVGKAGGGFSGFMKTLASSPAVWVAVAAAVAAGLYALIDYTSGAKAAREALEGLEKTAKSWKDTAAETFYGNSKGLSFFGMSEDDFTRQTGNAQSWVNGLIAVWSDGQKETDEIVNSWTDSFKALTASTRTELEELKAVADESGYSGVSADIQADIDQLDAMDAEIERLLKKKKNGKLSEKDKIRLQELIDTREAIEIKYHLSAADTDGFDTVIDKVEAEIARAQARGQADADVTVYENAVVSLAEGMAAVNKQLDAQYDKEYAVIQLIEDEDERRAAMEALDARYREDRRTAALEYAEALAGVVMPVWQQSDIQDAQSDVNALISLMTDYSTASHDERISILQQMDALAAGMDEGAMTEYITLLTQVQSLLDSGLTEEEITAMFPDIDFTKAMDQIAAIQAFLNQRPNELSSLQQMFGEALPEEILKIATDLDMTGAQARWNEFAENPGAITTAAIISGYEESEAAAAQQPRVEAFIAKYTTTDETDKSALTPEGLVAYIGAYAEATSGADVSALTPSNVTAMVSAYEELASGTDISTLKPDEITAYIMNYLEKEGVDTSALTPDAVTAFVVAYEEVTGGALTTSLTPTDIAATVTKYLQAEGVDMSKLTEPQLDAIITAFAEATNCDKSALKAEVVAMITAYEEAEGVEKPTFIQTKIAITGYDLTAYRRFLRENPVEVAATVRLNEIYDDPTAALYDPDVTFWQDGVEVPASAVMTEQLRPDTVAVLDGDGTMHILITPEITGTEEAVQAAEAALQTQEHQGSLGARWFGDTTLDDIRRLNEYLHGVNNEMNSWLNFGGWMNSWDRDAASGTLSNYLDMEEIGAIQTYVAEAVAAINNGEKLDEATITNLQSILELVQLLDSIGVGENVTSGIAEGMTEAGWDSTAETVASDMEDAINKALQINSPSKRMMPIGEYASAGIAEGVSGYDFSSSGSAVASAVENAVSGNLTRTSLRTVGVNAMLGLAAGINAGHLTVVAAMKKAARAAVNAAKQELKIASPSGVFRDEVGVMVMKGLGEGALDESKETAKTIRNATRYLTEAAVEGSTSSASNNRTYNSNSNISFTGSNFYLRDEQDIYSLAVEIASLTRRQQRGKGFRMA